MWVVWQNCPAQFHMKHETFLRELETKLSAKYDLAYLMDYVAYHKDHQPVKYRNLQYEILRPIVWNSF